MKHRLDKKKTKDEEDGIRKCVKMAECENNNDVTQPTDSEAGPPKLSELLDNGWKIFEEVDSTNEPLGSNSIQVRVKRGISMLEEASRMVAQLDLFSRNEELEEIATADLKYLLLPALLGALTMKQTSREKRLDIVQSAQAYFMDFLKRCKEYNVAKFELPNSTSENTSPDGASENGFSTATVSGRAKYYTSRNDRQPGAQARLHHQDLVENHVCLIALLCVNNVNMSFYYIIPCYIIASCLRHILSIQTLRLL